MTDHITIKECLTFDDVLLEPAYSTVLPNTANTTTQLTKNIALAIPLLSAAMDTVTESKMAIFMAQSGGLGIIHKNMTTAEQADEVKRVKRYEAGIVTDPITVTPEVTLTELIALKKKHGISGFPVVDSKTHKLVGIITNRDVYFATDDNATVADLMTSDLVTVERGISTDDAMALLHKNRIEKLLMVDGDGHCVGMITTKDIKNLDSHPNATKDDQGRLRVGAATGTGEGGYDRAVALINAGADVIIVDTAHGHSAGVIEQVKRLKSDFPHAQIIGGNIATPAAAEALIDAGADAVKIGIGPGSICTTRIIAGVGVAQLSAIMETAELCLNRGVPCIADGGMKTSGDLAKAIAGGANCAMVGSLLAGTDESPGDVFLHNGRSYKSYRGMGSESAMARGSADRYFQESVSDTHKFVPEGVEGRVPYKGTAEHIIYQMIGGLKSSMGYTGHATISSMQQNCTFRRVTNAGLTESHVHDVTMTREPANYRKGE